MEMGQYLEIFIEESKEHLQNLNQSLLQLEQHPSDSAMLNEIFRAAHTIKGMAGTMGYGKMSALTHSMEDVLHLLRSGEMQASSKLIDLLFKCLDALEKHLNNIISSSSEGSEDNQELINQLIEIKNNKGVAAKEEPIPKHAEQEAPKKQEAPSGADPGGQPLNIYEQNVINKAIEVGMNAFFITLILNRGCLLKSARAFIIFQTLEKYCEIIHSDPSVQDIEDEHFDFQFSVVIVTEESQESIFSKLNSIAEVDSIEIQVLAFESIESQAEDSQVIDESNPEEPDEKAVEGKAESGAATGTAAAKPRTGKTVRVDIERLDTLMNLVSELIIIKTRLEGINGINRTQNYNEAVEYLERITTNMHDAVMKVRMVPVETVFNRFPRMIRDISKDLGKEIILTMSGEETELDRTVIDEIGDPLIHLLRNSADHGIETIDARKKNGKPEAGNINLRAYQAGNNVIIEVEDDGAGINVEKVRIKAIDKGIISRDVANTIPDKDIIELLFKPSFSTADQVTDLSGRGVGLDVVKTKIEALGGITEVETEAGKGSKFIIRLPLTLAIIQALLVMVGSEKYAIPLNAIKEIINISPDEIKMVQRQEVILLRNIIVPIVRLDRILEVTREDEAPRQLTVVIVKKGEKASGFLVDSLIGQQEIVIKSLGKLLLGIKNIAGATILGDGNVALILDVNSLI